MTMKPSHLEVPLSELDKEYNLNFLQNIKPYSVQFDYANRGNIFYVRRFLEGDFVDLIILDYCTHYPKA